MPGGIVVEVQRVDVLVLLRRVLGVGDRAVGQHGEPLGMRPAPTGGRARTAARGPAPPPCRASRAAATKSSKSSMRAQLRVDRRRGRPRRCRSPTVSRRRWVRRSRCCCGPCGAPCRSDGSAAGRPRRSPSWRCADSVLGGGCEGAVTGLPLASQPPVDRGNISYHALNRANGRSTQTPYCSPRVTNSRSGYCSSTLGHFV